MRQPWIHSAPIDGIFILGVPFFIVAIAFIFHAHFSLPDSMTVISWAILVMGVDVSHVYSTLYRTYLDRETRARHGTFLYLLPFAVFVGCMSLYAIGALTFWRVMAYLAVFHFARQQYGFMRVYSRNEYTTPWQRRIDVIAIYTATLYPIIDWHLAGQKNFNWFMKGDFLYLQNFGLRSVLELCYFLVIGTYVLKEAIALKKNRHLNLPRNVLIAGTFLSWYVGIVYFNSDLAFTAINVVSHGVPYMALVWIWGHKKSKQAHAEGMDSFAVFRSRYVALFLISLLILAYVEEGFWSAWVWHDAEHRDFFAIFHNVLGDLEVNSPWLKIIVPLLSVPQITHYVIDGFIWKLRDDRYSWRDITLPNRGLSG